MLRAQDPSDWQAADRRARRAPETLWQNLPELTDYLCPSHALPAERARAIYAWITLRIDYDDDAYREGRKRINRHIRDILDRRRAVCFGYAQLFEAMARRAGLTVELISGYSKGTLTAEPELEAPDHAWNAVLLDGRWQLLDATWGSAVLDKDDPFLQTESDQYFLVTPDSFLLTHLPAQPMWQLLPCPLPARYFYQPADSIRYYLQTTEPCFNYADSIASWRRLSPPNRKLEAARSAYRYNPTGKNRTELAQSLMDYAGALTDSSETLQSRRQLDSLISLQERILNICEEASVTADELFPWQLELFIGTLINQAVAEVQRVYGVDEKEKVKAACQRAENHLKKALDLLDQLPADSLYGSVARRRCAEYLDLVREYLKE